MAPPVTQSSTFMPEITGWILIAEHPVSRITNRRESPERPHDASHPSKMGER